MITGYYVDLYLLLDAIDFIREHSNELKEKEKKDISDPLILARTVFRRILGNHFKGFEIRKNLKEYSIRCDGDIYKAFNVYTGIDYRGYIHHIDNDLKAKIEPFWNNFSQISSILSRNGFSFNSRSDGRLFIYIQFIPSAPEYNWETSTNPYANFRTTSLAERIENVALLSKALSKIEISPIVDKFNVFLRKMHGMPSSIANDRFTVTEEFIDFVISEQYVNPYDIVNKFLKYKKEQEEAREKKEEAARIEVASSPVVEITPDVDINVQAIVSDLQQDTHPANTVGNARVRLRPITSNPQPVLIANEELQEQFNRTLERIQRTRLEDTRFLRIPLEDVESEETVSVDMERILVDIMSNSINYNIFLPPLEYNKMREFFPSTNQDIGDDFDEEKSGLYFGLLGSDLYYAIYNNGEKVLETTDYSVVDNYYKGNMPEEIRFIQEEQNNE